MFGWLFNLLWTRKRRGAGDKVLEAARFTLHQGHRYKATVTLSFFEQLGATNDLIGGKLVSAGFKEVKISGDGEKRLAEGTWGRPDVTGSIDDHLSNVTEVRQVVQPVLQPTDRSQREDRR